MKKNPGIQNLDKMDLEKIGQGASFMKNENSQTEKPKEVEKVGKRKGFLIYPHEALLEILKEGKKTGKLPVAIGPYFITAAKEKLIKDGFEKELREKGLL